MSTIYKRLSPISKILIVSLCIANLLFLSVRLDLIKIPSSKASGSFSLQLIPSSTTVIVGNSMNLGIQVCAQDGFSGNVRASVSAGGGAAIEVSSLNDHLSGWGGSVDSADIPIGTGSGENECNFIAPTLMFPAGGTPTVSVSVSGGGYSTSGSATVTNDPSGYSWLIMPNSNKLTTDAGSSASSSMAQHFNPGYSGTLDFSCQTASGKGISCGVSPSSVNVGPGGMDSASFYFNSSSSTPNGYYFASVKSGTSGSDKNHQIGIRVKVNNSSSSTPTPTPTSTTTSDSGSGPGSGSGSGSGSSSGSTGSSPNSSSNQVSGAATKAGLVENISTAELSLSEKENIPGVKIKANGSKFNKDTDLTLWWDPYVYGDKNQGGKANLGSVKTDSSGKFENLEITIPSGWNAFLGKHVILATNGKVGDGESSGVAEFGIRNPTEEEQKTNPNLKVFTQEGAAKEILWQNETKKADSNQGKIATDLLTKSITDEKYVNDLPALTEDTQNEVTGFSGSIKMGNSDCSFKEGKIQSSIFSIVSKALAGAISCPQGKTALPEQIETGAGASAEGVKITADAIELSSGFAVRSTVEIEKGENKGSKTFEFPYTANGSVALPTNYPELLAKNLVGDINKLQIELVYVPQQSAYEACKKVYSGEIANIESSKITGKEITDFISKMQEVNKNLINEKTKCENEEAKRLKTNISQKYFSIDDLIDWSKFPKSFRLSRTFDNYVLGQMKEKGMNTADGIYMRSFFDYAPIGDPNDIKPIGNDNAADKPIYVGDLDDAEIGEVYPTVEQIEKLEGIYKVKLSCSKEFKEIDNPLAYECEVPIIHKKEFENCGKKSCVDIGSSITENTKKLLRDPGKLDKEYKGREPLKKEYNYLLEEFHKEQAKAINEVYHKKNQTGVGANASISTNAQSLGNVAFTEFTGGISKNDSPEQYAKFSFNGKALAADEQNSSEDNGQTNYIQIESHDSKIALLVTDPLGRNTGYNTLAQKPINQIEGSQYLEPLKANSRIYIPGVSLGEYEIRLIGLEDGKYNTDITLAIAGKNYKQNFSGDIKQNEVVYGVLDAKFDTDSTAKLKNFFSDFWKNPAKWIPTLIAIVLIIGFGIYFLRKYYLKRKMNSNNKNLSAY